MTAPIPSALSDCDLIATVRQVAGRERETTSNLVALIEQVDARRLYLGEGYSSMFMFCTRSLHMSEQAAYSRIEAARLSRRFPIILAMLADGRLSLATVGLLAPHLSDENCGPLLDAASFQSKRDVERLIAALHPQPDIPAMIRARSQRATPPPAAASDREPPVMPAPQSTVKPGRPPLAPLAPRSYLLRVTISEDAHRRFERARDLLRHEIPDGDPAVIIDRALTLLVAAAEKTKFAATVEKPRARTSRASASRTRRIPAAIRREVWARDEGRCAFQGTDGRCGETGFLEFHHLVPYATGGATTPRNLELRCRAHNIHEAELAGLARTRQPALIG